MNAHPACAVCGATIDPGNDHVKIDKERIRIGDRNEQDQYFLHGRCAQRVIGNWERP